MNQRYMKMALMRRGEFRARLRNFPGSRSDELFEVDAAPAASNGDRLRANGPPGTAEIANGAAGRPQHADDVTGDSCADPMTSLAGCSIARAACAQSELP